MSPRFENVEFFMQHLPVLNSDFSDIFASFSFRLTGKRLLSRLSPVCFEIFEKFTGMRTAFCDIKYTYDMNGFEYFGFNGMQYVKLVDFIYKGSKILEYFYLRNSKYEDLQNLRNSILVYIENEHHKIGNIQAR